MKSRKWAIILLAGMMAVMTGCKATSQNEPEPEPETRPHSKVSVNVQDMARICQSQLGRDTAKVFQYLVSAGWKFKQKLYFSDNMMDGLSEYTYEQITITIVFEGKKAIECDFRVFCTPADSVWGYWRDWEIQAYEYQMWVSWFANVAYGYDNWEQVYSGRSDNDSTRRAHVFTHEELTAFLDEHKEEEGKMLLKIDGAANDWKDFEFTVDIPINETGIGCIMYKLYLF